MDLQPGTRAAQRVRDARRRARRGRGRSARRCTARAGARRLRVHVRVAAAAARVGELAQQQVDWHGSRPRGWPAPSSATSRAHRQLGDLDATLEGDDVIASPVDDRDGAGDAAAHRMPRRLSYGSRSSPSMLAISASGVVSSPHATQSSICLVECGSTKTSAKKNSRKSR
jgi:hypothetical protein